MAPPRLFVTAAVILCSLALAFVHPRPTLGQTSINIEEVGRITLPPIPPESPPGLVSDLWVAGGFAYVGRYGHTPYRVELFDVRVPGSPISWVPCPSLAQAPIGPPTEAHEVEDVVVEDRFLYVAIQDNVADIDGVKVHDLVNLASPSCTGPSAFIAGIPSAHDMFLYDHSNGTRMLIVATLRPNASRGIHILNVNSPGAPTSIAFLPYPTIATGAYCDPTAVPSFPPIPDPPQPPPCGPHDIYAQRMTPTGPDFLVVAGLTDGAYIYDITVPTVPVRLAHFNYIWETPDIDGDGVSDCCDLFGNGECDDTNFSGGPPDDLDKLFVSNTHDARITLDGEFLWTADEKGCGGHVLTWSLADILTRCGDADGCRAGLPAELEPVGEFWLNTPMPYSVHQLRWYSANYAFLPWYEEGVRVLGITNDPSVALNPAAAPLEVGFFDSLVPNTDGCIENGAPGAACTGPIRVLNPGFFGDWGVTWDNCYLYIADRGSPDNDEIPPDPLNPDAGATPGALIALRYTGGPTTPQPLRISKDLTNPGDLIASWGEVPFASLFNIYRGTIPKTATGGGLGTRPPGSEYDHTMVDPVTACDRPGNSAVLFSQFTPTGATCNNGTDDDADTLIDCADNTGGVENCSADQSCQPYAYYYLVTARSPCDPAADREGNYGQDSFGVNRPTAAPSLGCPLCMTCPL